MKIIAVILSFIFISLSAVPIIDFAKGNVLHKIELSTTSDNNNQGCTDHCSPFCLDQCCQSLYDKSDFSVSFNAAMSQIRYFERTPFFHNLYLFDILIPPK